MPPRLLLSERVGERQVVPKPSPRSHTDLSEVLAQHRDSLSGLGAGDLVLANLAQLQQRDAVVVLTGQQTGLFGGPLYSLNKAIHAVHLARQLGRDWQRPVVPVFWCLSEDTDIDEGNDLGVLGPFSKPLHLKLPVGAQPVGQVMGNLLWDGEKSWKWLAERVLIAGQQQDTVRQGLGGIEQRFRFLNNQLIFRELFVRLLLDLSKNTGLVPFLPDLPSVKRALLPLSFKIVEQSSDLVASVSRAGEELDKQGIRPQLRKQPWDAAFAMMKNGLKHKIFHGDGGLVIDNEIWRTADLLHHIERQPSTFATNVISNPVAQSYLLPVAALLLGPGEMAYHRQLPDVFQSLGIEQPPRIARSNITYVPKRLLGQWRDAGLSTDILLEDRREWQDRFLYRPSPLLQSGLWEDAEKHLQHAASILEREAMEGTPLRRQRENFRRDLLRRLARFKDHVRRTVRTHENPLLANTLWQMDAVISPEGGLQERSLSIFWLLLQHPDLSVADILDVLFEDGSEQDALQKVHAVVGLN